MSNNLLTLGKGVYLSKPITDSVLRGPGRQSGNGPILQPTVILLFSWMGAQLPHLLKYSNAYREIYPEATQILVRSEASFFWKSEAAKKAYLAPAVTALENLGLLPPRPVEPKTSRDGSKVEPVLPLPPTRLLVHTFSNGGSWQLAMMGSVLASRSSTSEKSPTTAAFVLDSCPGDGGVDGTLRAFSGVIPHPILRAIVRFTIRVLYAYAAIMRRVFFPRRETMLEKMKKRLNDKNLLPWFSTNTPRLYLYSVKDDVIPYREVEAHAAEAEHLGFKVKLEKFEDSAHVAHAKTYPERYWSAIQTMWDDACQVSGSRCIEGCSSRLE